MPTFINCPIIYFQMNRYKTLNINIPWELFHDFQFSSIYLFIYFSQY